MEFSVFRQVLIRALGHMQSIVEKRATLPILMNVKIEVADDLVLSATNVDLELVEHVEADITLGGKITVPVQMLYDIVRKLPDASEISFKQSGDQLVVSSGRAVFRLPTLPAENFPAMAGSNLTTKFQMTTGDLAHLINQTKFAIPTDDVRYHLGGIYFHISDEGKEKMLTAVATDAFRLSVFPKHWYFNFLIRYFQDFLRYTICFITDDNHSFSIINFVNRFCLIQTGGSYLITVFLKFF